MASPKRAPVRCDGVMPGAIESRHASSPLLRARDVAERLCLSEATVWRLARESVLPRVRIAGSTRFRPGDVHALIARGLSPEDDEGPAGKPGPVTTPAGQGRHDEA